MNRKQRRASEKKMRTETSNISKIIPQATSSDKTDELKNQIINLAKDVKSIFDYTKSLEFKLSLITESLVRTGVMSFEDIKETQFLYSKKEENKNSKIKELLSQDLEISDILEIITDTPETPGYLRLNIDPVKDLNVNPYELAQFLRDSAEGVSLDEVIKYSKRYGLNESHFGISSPKNIQP